MGDNLEYKSFSLDVKSTDDLGRFTGIAATYSLEPDLVGDIIKRGAFTKSLKEHGNQFPLLWSHMLDQPVGLVDLEDSQDALLADAQLELELSEGQKSYTRVKKKLARGLSIGFDKRRTKSYVKDGVRYLTEIPLLEVSLCTIPVDQGAWVTSVKALLAQKAPFSEVLEKMELMSGAYMMLDALRESLWTTSGDLELTDEEKVGLADTSIDEFHRQYMEYLPKYLAVVAVMAQADRLAQGNEMRSAAEVLEGKAGRRISSASHTRIQEAMRLHEGGIREHQRGLKVMKALLDAEAAGTGTSTKGAAADPEPEPLHSLDLSGLFRGWGSHLLTSKTNN